MYFIYFVTAVALFISIIADRKKTATALKIAGKKFYKILPALLLMLILMSVVLSYVPDSIISKYLGARNKPVSFFLALGFGSITIMPGFIAFPLASILLKKGVTYIAISAFTTTLMLVGIITYPLEKEYFGANVTIIRNLISLLIAAIVSLATGLLYGEF